MSVPRQLGVGIIGAGVRRTREEGSLEYLN